MIKVLRTPDPNCDCQGRGWFAGDMMASFYIACKRCNTHEAFVGKEYGYCGIKLQKGCSDV